MTPFGARVRRLRRERGITLKKMAGDLNLSPAYLSALEHGRRGRPAPGLVRQVCAYFDIIWDEAEELERLAALSHPRIVVDTAGLAPEATELANRLAANIRDLPADTVKRLLAELKSASRRAPRLKG
jgi:transcriptional regulator with XRE-family HTH domain